MVLEKVNKKKLACLYFKLPALMLRIGKSYKNENFKKLIFVCFLGTFPTGLCKLTGWCSFNIDKDFLRRSN